MVTLSNLIRGPEVGAEVKPALDRPFAAAARVLAEAMAALEARLAEEPVSDPVEVGAIRRRLAARYDLAHPLPAGEVACDVFELLYKGMVHPNHSRHFGLFVPGTRAAGVIADALVALLNPQAGGWFYAPAASEIETFVLDALAARIGFDPEQGAAHFTSGGSEANATAVVLALTRAFPAYRMAGLAATTGGRPVFYVSDQAHDSFVKIAHQAGLGRDAVRRVRSDGARRLDLDDLRRLHARDLGEGARPFLVVGTAGTTAAGAFDPLSELAAFAREHELWMHADAAWGGLALLVDELRPLVKGIELADSVTWDAHKVLPVPMGAGMFFARSRAGLAEAFGVETAYVPAEVAGTVDLYQHSMQWSRRFIGLKVFLTLAELGWAGVAALLRHQVAMGRRLRDQLAGAGFLLVNNSPLPLVCFTHPLIAAGERSADEVVADLIARGQAWISAVHLAPGEPKALRACITNHRTGPADLDVLVSELSAVLGGAASALY